MENECEQSFASKLIKILKTIKEQNETLEIVMKHSAKPI